MSFDGMDEDSRAEAQDGPGRRLRALRQSRELSLPRAAVMLHLDEATLTALEEEDFEHLPGPVFVQGYLKNYARLLDTPAEPILDAYRRLKPNTEKQTLRVVRMKHEVKSSHVVVRLVTWLIVLALISLLVTWWRGYLTWPVVAEDPELRESVLPGDGEGPAVATVENEPVLLPSESGSIALPATVSTEEYAEQEAAAEMEPGTPATVPETSEPPAPATLAAEAVPMDAAAEPAPGAVQDEPDEAAGTETELRGVEIVFVEDCWTDIRDASGRFRIQGVVRKGERRQLEGEPPYKVVLGNAGGVKISVDGAAYDLTPHTRANVARFTLDPANL